VSGPRRSFRAKCGAPGLTDILANLAPSTSGRGPAEAGLIRERDGAPRSRAHGPSVRRGVEEDSTHSPRGAARTGGRQVRADVRSARGLDQHRASTCPSARSFRFIGAGATKKGPGTLADCLQKGRAQIAAGYILYGSSTMLVYTTGQGVHGFTLDPTIGEFLLSHPNPLARRGQYYSVNESHWKSGPGHPARRGRVQERRLWPRRGEERALHRLPRGGHSPQPDVGRRSFCIGRYDFAAGQAAPAVRSGAAGLRRGAGRRRGDRWPRDILDIKPSELHQTHATDHSAPSAMWRTHTRC